MKMVRPPADQLRIDHQPLAHRAEDLDRAQCRVRLLQPFEQRVVRPVEELQHALHRRRVSDRVGGVKDHLAVERAGRAAQHRIGRHRTHWMIRGVQFTGSPSISPAAANIRSSLERELERVNSTSGGGHSAPKLQRLRETSVASRSVLDFNDQARAGAWREQDCRGGTGMPGHGPPFHFFSRSSRALTATITVLVAISAAPTAGVSTTPHANNAPAASGMAKTL